MKRIRYFFLVASLVLLAAGFLFMGERPSWKQTGFSLLSIAGVVVMTLQQSSGGTVQPLGVALLIGAVICGAAFNIISRSLSGTFSALERTYVMMLMAAAAFTALAVIETKGNAAQLLAPAAKLPFMGSMLYLSLFSSILAFLCLNYAATILPVGKSTAFCNVTTVLSVFAGVVFLGEPVSVVSLIAAAVIIVGVFGVQKTDQRRNQHENHLYRRQGLYRRAASAGSLHRGRRPLPRRWHRRRNARPA